MGIPTPAKYKQLPNYIAGAYGDDILALAVALSDILLRLDNPGLSGAVTTIDTSAITGNFQAIQILTDAQFSTFTETDGTGSMTGFVIPAGTVIYGKITAYTLTSGRIRAYRAS